ncbi:MAG: hypothetical protein HYY15_01475 [Candidatus Omnitrophica bacterium]|nr:hypothetical protein [Candidatus Omnitrophota bacterium]
MRTRGGVTARARDVLAVVGTAVLLLLALEGLAFLLRDVRISRPGVPHPTSGRPQKLAPDRMRVVKQEFHSPQLNIDRDGFRTGRPAGQRQFDDWGSLRDNVLAFGGGQMFGWSVDDADTIPAQLEAMARGAGLSWRVYNMGITDYAIHDELSLLIDQLREGRVPKAVIFYDGINESGRGIPAWTTDEALTAPYAAGDYEYFWVADLVARGQRTVNLENSAFANLLHRLCMRLGLCQRIPPAVQRASLEQQAAHAKAAAHAYVQYARMVDALSEEFEFAPLFILQPMAGCVEGGADYPFPYPGVLRPWQLSYGPRLYGEIERQMPPGLKVVNLCEPMSEAVASGLKPFHTSLSLSPEGFRFVAEQLFPLLRRHLAAESRSR